MRTPLFDSVSSYIDPPEKILSEIEFSWPKFPVFVVVFDEPMTYRYGDPPTFSVGRVVELESDDRSLISPYQSRS